MFQPDSQRLNKPTTTSNVIFKFYKFQKIYKNFMNNNALCVSMSSFLYLLKHILFSLLHLASIQNCAVNQSAVSLNEIVFFFTHLTNSRGCTIVLSQYSECSTYEMNTNIFLFINITVTRILSIKGQNVIVMRLF